MDALSASLVDEQQATWKQVYDIIAENCVLYPLVHVQTVTASWDDASKSPSGTAIEGFCWHWHHGHELYRLQDGRCVRLQPISRLPNIRGDTDLNEGSGHLLLGPFFRKTLARRERRGYE